MQSNDFIGLKIRVHGIVQGVGFRPFVYTNAIQNNLTGWVRNTSNGVEIEVNGASSDVDTFVSAFHLSPPPLARIDTFKTEQCPPNGYETFEILESQLIPGEFLPISPDMAICKDCLREMFDPSDRRFRYPFINCTNCGPRFTIIQDIPYDRPKTTMAGFALCPDCLLEYQNPQDRRFHAQPVACPECGPQLFFQTTNQTLAHQENALQMARQWIKDGKIVAIKGLGGFHLACDASNQDAVKKLRERKRRSDKPFAVMTFDIEQIEQHCELNEQEKLLLTSNERPVVLLDRKPESTIAYEVAPRQNTLGFMLPYTPLHYLLLEPEDLVPDVWVMTSGNLSEEPIAFDDMEAKERLSHIADGFLMHDRPIYMRVDDSVSRVINSHASVIRRARGYAPNSTPLPIASPPIFAAGAELKNTFCLTRNQYAFISHHIGDLENYETLKSYEAAIVHYQNLFRIRPEYIAIDLHPDYLSSQYGLKRAQNENITLIKVQHHHAHLAACLAENQWTADEPVIGLCLDGTGLGTDGAIWGGEVLSGNYAGFQRAAHLSYTPLPGGDAAVRKPARMALAHLWKSGLEWASDLAPVKALSTEEKSVVHTQLEKRINSPETSSMGRLFDAVSAFLGLCEEINYEGQAAIELEIAADKNEDGIYPFPFVDGKIDLSPFWHSLSHDWRSGTPVSKLSARFHNSIAYLCFDMAKKLKQETGCRTVALSGGVWQNRFLFQRTVRLLEKAGFMVLFHQKIPTNDGGISLGQAMIAAKYYQLSMIGK